MNAKKRGDLAVGSYMIIPRGLIGADLSLTAKFAYILLLDRARQSESGNKFRDDDGRAFVYFSVSDMAKRLSKSERTAKRAMAELKKSGLVERRAGGQRIYVNAPPVFSVPNGDAGRKNADASPVSASRESVTLSSGGEANVTADVSYLSPLKGRECHPSNNNMIKNNISKTGEQKARARGTYKNVYIDDDEYKSMSVQIPELDRYIERLSLYMRSSGRKYASHAATIRKWFMDDGAQSREYAYAEGESL